MTSAFSSLHPDDQRAARRRGSSASTDLAADGLLDGDIGEREFFWTSEDFERIRTLIRARAGIHLHSGKQAMAYSRVARRLRDTGHKSFHDYLNWLEQLEDNAEWQEFVNVLTTNLTAFFREPHHFELLSTWFTQHPDGPWHVWSCAASTGEEPYSIVMTAHEMLGAQASRFKLIASDIDSRVLARAAEGVFRADHLKGLSEERLHRFFLRGTGSNSGLVRVRPPLQQAVDFQQINLIDADWPFQYPLDVVFCRNVMIYFDSGTQRRVLERLYGVMRPGGLLFVGHAEHFSDARDLFVLRGKTVYERL
ncbi:chemotaxis protein CheR [Diaphorobacter sp. HDW4A]|uniref:CheR family methyltransferase n=1 Tax=Diaphorobacter sp. HDW4A TaxID=2714924 RepID=UPI001407A6C5|nr:CheR family methyltransferase [Diaphorobacter sp. HDW4A]QIL83245.1 chemotaxis protein CheR [Diaphorobacter sp. HDW4A]